MLKTYPITNNLTAPFTEVKIQSFPVEIIRKDFPILLQKIHGKPLVYLDNAATTQKPQVVIDAISNYYQNTNSNVHRGVHYLSEQATCAYEDARQTIKNFINANDIREIIFVRGTTEAINLVAQSYGYSKIKANDEILITEMEHHSNIVPWQLLCERIGAQLRVIPINDHGEISLDSVKSLLNERTRLVAITHLSNALGTINPIKEVIQLAHSVDVPVLVDGAQAAPHLAVDVQALDCDFYTFSGHKLFGPTGIGILYGKAKLLENMPPYQGGGEMILQVSFKKTTYNSIPAKFEAGTPNISGAIGLASAINYINSIGLSNIAAYEQQLLAYIHERAQDFPGLQMIGTAQKKSSIFSFILKDIHAHDIGTILDHHGIAIRAGHHCAMPVMEHFGISATARVSLAFYNTYQEIDYFFTALAKVQEVFQ